MTGFLRCMSQTKVRHALVGLSAEVDESLLEGVTADGLLREVVATQDGLTDPFAKGQSPRQYGVPSLCVKRHWPSTDTA